MHDASRARGVAAVTPSDAAAATMADCITIDGNDTSLFRRPTCREKKNNILFTEGISKPLKKTHYRLQPEGSKLHNVRSHLKILWLYILYGWMRTEN